MNEEFEPTKLEEIFWIRKGIDVKVIRERFRLEPLRRHKDGYYFIRAYDKLKLTTEDVKVSESFFEENSRYLSLAIGAQLLLNPGSSDIKKLSDVREQVIRKKVGEGFLKIGKYIAASITGLVALGAGIALGDRWYRNYQFNCNADIIQEAIDSADHRRASALLYEFVNKDKLKREDKEHFMDIIEKERRRIDFKERVKEAAKKSAKKASEREEELILRQRIVPITNTSDLENKLNEVSDREEKSFKPALSGEKTGAIFIKFNGFTDGKTKDDVKAILEGITNIPMTKWFGNKLVIYGLETKKEYNIGIDLAGKRLNYKIISHEFNMRNLEQKIGEQDETEFNSPEEGLAAIGKTFVQKLFDD